MHLPARFVPSFGAATTNCCTVICHYFSLPHYRNLYNCSLQIITVLVLVRCSWAVRNANVPALQG